MRDWKSISIKECGEKLVALGPFSLYPELQGSAIYAGEHMDSPYYPKGIDGSLLTHFVREDVAVRLRLAKQMLPRGIVLYLWDSYRDIKTQRGLFTAHTERLTRECPSLSAEAIHYEAQKLVALPSEDPLKPSPHNSGGAIDLTLARLPLSKWVQYKFLVYALELMKKRAPHHETPFWFLINLRLSDIFRRYSSLLPMGTQFDEDKPETAAYYYDTKFTRNPYEEEYAANRHFMRETLKGIDFSQYKHEWWHVNFGNQTHACDTGLKFARYGAATLSEENIQHELMRRLYYSLHMRWNGHRAPYWCDHESVKDIQIEPWKMRLIKRWAHVFSPPNMTQHTMAAKL